MSDASKDRYTLTRLVLESTSSVAIDEANYNSIRTAKRLLSGALTLEQKFELVISNEIEMEKTCNSIALESFQRHYDYDSMQDGILVVNQRVNNVLASCRGYLDQMAHHTSELEVLCPGLFACFKQATAKQYDQHASYRLAEALRNHALHQGFAIGQLRTGSEQIKLRNGEDAVSFSVQAFVDVAALQENSRTKPIVVEYLRNLTEQVDARPVLREYVASLARIHAELRVQLSALVTEAEKTLNLAIDNFQKASSEESVIGLAAVRLAETGVAIEKIAIFREFMERRRRLELRNANFENLAGWHVSSEPRQRRIPLRRSQ